MSLQHAAAVTEVGKQTNRPVVVIGMAQCALLDMKVRSVYDDWTHCDAFVPGAMAWLAQQPPGTVVLASANSIIDQEHASITDRATDERATSPATRAALWERGLTRTMQQLREIGHNVLLVNVTPLIEEAITFRERCSLVRLHTRGCVVSEDLAELDRIQARSLGSEHRAASAAGVRELDLRADICPHSVCRTQIGSRLDLRRRAHHDRGEPATRASFRGSTGRFVDSERCRKA